MHVYFPSKFKLKENEKKEKEFVLVSDLVTQSAPSPVQVCNSLIWSCAGLCYSDSIESVPTQACQGYSGYLGLTLVPILSSIKLNCLSQLSAR